MKVALYCNFKVQTIARKVFHASCTMDANLAFLWPCPPHAGVGNAEADPETLVAALTDLVAPAMFAVTAETLEVVLQQRILSGKALQPFLQRFRAGSSSYAALSGLQDLFQATVERRQHMS